MFDEWNQRLVILDVLGDAEALVLDWKRLSDPQRQAFVGRHLAAFAKNLAGKGRSLAEFTPVMLLGRSMPPEVLGTVDLSASHEGTLLVGSKSGAVVYVAAGADPVAYLAYRSVQEIPIRESLRAEPYDVGSLSFDGAPTERSGFSLDQWKLARGGLAMVLGKRSGLLGVIERIFGSS